MNNDDEADDNKAPTTKPAIIARETNGRLMKGHPALAGAGRPRGRTATNEIARDILRANTTDAAFALVACLKAVYVTIDKFGVEHVSPDYDIRLKAAQTILDRVYGRPTLEIASAGGGPLPAIIFLPQLDEDS